MQTRQLAAQIQQTLLKKYGEVAADAAGHFPYPVGRASAQQLGYDAAWLDAIPPTVVSHFVGVGNPFHVHVVQPGQRVLDAGCGCGMDSFIASLLVGTTGHVTGLDLCAEMLAVPRAELPRWRPQNLEFVQGELENLPFADESFDVVISNGVLNLAVDKDCAFREIYRVLKPGGVLATADLLVIDSVPDAVLCSLDAWST
ncbi:MAG TPA: methyltransferase domain-containing protein [Planctomycetota bacterium]